MIPILLLCLIATPPNPHTLSPPPPSPITIEALDQRIAAEKPAHAERKARITAELATIPLTLFPPNHWAPAWAGSYRTILQRAGAQGALSIAPASGVAFESPRLEVLDHGPISCEIPGGGGLVIDWAIDAAYLTDSGISRRMWFVTWGAKSMVGSDETLLELVNSLNAGGTGMASLPDFFQRVGPDGAFAASAMERSTVRPVLPPEWAPRLLVQPVEFKATVVTPVRETEEQGMRHTTLRVTLDAGADRAAFIGMTLPFQRGSARGDLTIDKVDATSCEGELKVWSHATTPLTPPKPGEVFSLPGTSLPPPPAK